MDVQVWKAAARLIRANEVAGGDTDEAKIRSGFANYKAGSLHVPPNSGATLGFGFDAGQSTSKEIDELFGPVGRNGPQVPVLDPAQRALLKKFAGKKVVTQGQVDAAVKVSKKIQLSYDEATEVFERRIFYKKAILPASQQPWVDKRGVAHPGGFPGFDDPAIPAKQQIAILDRVYMRGNDVGAGENPKVAVPMLVELRQAVIAKDVEGIYLATKKMEALHHKPGTIKRAKARTQLAYEGWQESLAAKSNGIGTTYGPPSP